jgi:glucose/mannose transport system permease protein
MLAGAGLYGTISGAIIVHVIFSVPILTLLFRNFYTNMPIALFNAARVDGAGFWRILFKVFLPMSGPIIIVACILHGTGVWNDFIVGLIFAGRDNLPMMVQLNNLVGTTDGAREYNVEMAATVLTAAVPAVVYFVSGKWFVRGVMAGAMKG